MAKRTAPARRAACPRRAGMSPGRVSFTNTDKVWFPHAGLTKGDVLEFYRAIAPRLVPHLCDRPVTLERLPDGLRPGAPRFWQKNTPDYYPQWIPRVDLPGETGKPVKYSLVNDADALLYLVNQGAITFHVWPSRVQHLDRPDYVLFVIQNARVHHAVPPYVVRAVPEATVSTPLDWNELTPRLDPRKFTMEVVLKRIKKQKTDPLASLLAP